MVDATADPGAPPFLTRDLCGFVSQIAYESLPREVVGAVKSLFIDWMGSALAGRGHKAVKGLEAFATSMGPSAGPSTVLSLRRGTTPFFAALVNAAASHAVEQDDVHNASVFHPGTVVFPAALAMAESENVDGRRLIEAVVAGYETGIRVGEALGRSHYEVFHTTGTAGTLAAAAAAGKLLGLGAEALNDALGTAGTQAAGLWEFLGDAADSKQVHTAKAAGDGLLAAFLAREGVAGAKRIVEGRRGMAAGMSRDADPSRLTDGLGTRWAILETSYKWHASCRHTHPAADALALVLERDRLKADRIESVTAHVHRGAIDVLGAVIRPVTVHQAKFSMGTVLALIALHGKAGLAEFDEHALGRPVTDFLAKVSMEPDREIDAAYPGKWIGKVTVRTTDGRALQGRIDEPRGDPGNPLTLQEVKAKSLDLAAYGGGATKREVESWIASIEELEHRKGMAGLFSGDSG